MVHVWNIPDENIFAKKVPEIVFNALGYLYKSVTRICIDNTVLLLAGACLRSSTRTEDSRVNTDALQLLTVACFTSQYRNKYEARAVYRVNHNKLVKFGLILN